MRFQLPFWMLIGIGMLALSACCSKRAVNERGDTERPGDALADASPSEGNNEEDKDSGNAELDGGNDGTNEDDENLGEDAPPLIRGFDHEHQVQGLDFSSDGNYLVVCGGPQVRLWEHQKGVQKLLIERKNESFRDVMFRPDSEQLAAGTKEGKVYVWDLTGKLIATYDLDEQNDEQAVFRVAYSPDGSKLAAASGDKKTYIWQPETGETLQVLLGHEGEGRDVVFDPTDGNFVVTSGYDHQAHVWDLEQREKLFSVEHDPIVVHAVAISPDGDYAASAAGPGETVRIWSMETGNDIGSITTGHPGYSFHRARWNADGTMLAVAGGIFSRGFFSLWSVEINGDELVAERLAIVQTDGRGAGIYALDFSPDGKILATGSASGRIRLWSTGR